MFYVVNKSKIYSYLVALCTVVILFVAATTINDMVTPSENVVETTTNIVETNTNINTNKLLENHSISNSLGNVNTKY